jgi:Lon protease-like protein
MSSPNDDPLPQADPELKADTNSLARVDSEEYVPPDPYRLIAAIQCGLCARPLRTPIRLPCGKTICRACLPPRQRREGISYPQGEGREEGFVCPWKDDGCRGERGETEDGLIAGHALADCGVDVTLSKIMDVFERVLQEHADASTPDIRIQWDYPPPPLSSGKGEGEGEGEGEADGAVSTSATINLGRYLGTYKLSREGKLPLQATNVVYVDTVTNSEDPNAELDQLVVQELKQGMRDELDCQVCYGLIYEPWTSLCGHTFCRDCANRVLDHSKLCPLCRKRMYISTAKGHGGYNDTLNHFLWNVLDQETMSRRAAIQADYGVKADNEMPLFVCTLAYPSMLTFLHIFEPRYRLMIRRALDYGNQKFGMILPNPNNESAENTSGSDVANAPFMQYGTVVTIARSEFLSDGRIMVTAMGLTKFKVLRWDVLDGYYNAVIERVDDIGWEEEENTEAREVATTAAAASTAAAADSDATGEGEEASSTEPPPESLSTQQLMQRCVDFIEKRSADASPATHRRILTAYGPPPPDPAIFPYWLASVLPIPEDEAYKLLPLTSVRERLKLAATWPKMFDDSRWYTASLLAYRCIY